MIAAKLAQGSRIGKIDVPSHHFGDTNATADRSAAYCAKCSAQSSGAVITIRLLKLKQHNSPRAQFWARTRKVSHRSQSAAHRVHVPEGTDSDPRLHSTLCVIPSALQVVDEGLVQFARAELVGIWNSKFRGAVGRQNA